MALGLVLGGVLSFGGLFALVAREWKWAMPRQSDSDSPALHSFHRSDSDYLFAPDSLIHADSRKDSSTLGNDDVIRYPPLYKIYSEDDFKGESYSDFVKVDEFGEEELLKGKEWLVVQYYDMLPHSVPHLLSIFRKAQSRNVFYPAYQTRHCRNETHCDFRYSPWYNSFLSTMLWARNHDYAHLVYNVTTRCSLPHASRIIFKHFKHLKDSNAPLPWCKLGILAHAHSLASKHALKGVIYLDADVVPHRLTNGIDIYIKAWESERNRSFFNSSYEIHSQDASMTNAITGDVFRIALYDYNIFGPHNTTFIKGLITGILISLSTPKTTKFWEQLFIRSTSFRSSPYEQARSWVAVNASSSPSGFAEINRTLEAFGCKCVACKRGAEKCDCKIVVSDAMNADLGSAFLAVCENSTLVGGCVPRFRTKPWIFPFEQDLINWAYFLSPTFIDGLWITEDQARKRGSTFQSLHGISSRTSLFNHLSGIFHSSNCRSCVDIMSRRTLQLAKAAKVWTLGDTLEWRFEKAWSLFFNKLQFAQVGFASQ